MKRLISILLMLLFCVAVVSAVFYPEPWGANVDANNNDLDNVNDLTVTKIYATNITASGTIESAAFTIGGVNVGTSNDSYWNNASSNIYFMSGNVGVKTSSPVSDFEVNGTITATEVRADINWTMLQNYPVACPGSGAITLLNDSVTCSDLWVDVAGDTMTGKFTTLNVTPAINVTSNLGNASSWYNLLYIKTIYLDTLLTDAQISDTLTASIWDGETSQLNLSVNNSVYWDGETSQADLNVNSSDHWDNYNLSTDITALGTIANLLATNITVTDRGTIPNLITVNLTATTLLSNLDATGFNLTAIDEVASTLIDTTNLEAVNLESDLDGTGFNITINYAKANNFTYISDIGLTGNYSNGNCWNNYGGGILTHTNCTAV